jgi:hypothetical protein
MGGGGLNYLIRRQLEVVSLIRDQVAQLHGEMTSAIGDDQREIPILKVNIVDALEVVEDGDLLLSVGLLILPLERSVLCVSTILGSSPGEALNGISLVICSKYQQDRQLLEGLWSLPSALPLCLTRNFNLANLRKLLKSSDWVKPLGVLTGFKRSRKMV